MIALAQSGSETMQKESELPLQTTEMNGLLGGGEYFDLKANEIDDTFRVFVATPFIEPGKKYPVVYFLDGNGTFPLAMLSQTTMAMDGDLPPVFIVGIGYTSFQSLMNRGRDYTPTPVRDHRKVPHAGGPEFLKFLMDEVRPLIEKHYPVDPENSALAGHSVAGLFAAWVMLTEPGSFANYLISSPSLQTNDEEVWEWEANYAKQHSNLEAKVFVSAGGLEDDNRAKLAAMATKNPAYKEIIADFEENGWPRGQRDTVPDFVEKLKSRGYPNLEMTGIVFPDETHMSVLPGAISRGLRYLFGDLGLTPKRE